MDLLQTLTAAVLGNAIVLAILGWLGKSLLEKLIQRDSKRFEIEIRAKADSTIEQLKNELQLRTIEHEIKLSRLHEKRAAVIADLNGLLAEVVWEAESFLSPMQFSGEPDKRQKHDAAMSKLVEFFRYFDKNKIYLPAVLCETTEKVVRDIRQHVIKFGVYLEWGDDTLMDHTRNEKYKALHDGWNAIKNHVPAARTQLENEFRALLAPGG